ncbi:hypothetical protein GFS24_17840 [Chitinophaga sp. SYP-B3965]|uniref:hypothetical protein n=1 Tax=Chitinophaga sp. SYP-B3965 TaxID=2663120 RepID=UPI001299C91F|nr:hypothetical protein [Chitinophaga sp. SYP-B3965]MRG46989.1 hypothetical protein [Chitinophaga sp. SYP-B3965]
MINFSELKAGDIVLAKFEEQVMEGKVLQVDHELKQVCVLTHEEQESWYSAEDLFPIPLTEEQLVKLKFSKAEENGNGQAYVRGPFTVVLSQGAAPNTVLHYRDETRNIAGGIMVHQLQNHYAGMTLFHLE